MPVGNLSLLTLPNFDLPKNQRTAIHWFNKTRRPSDFDATLMAVSFIYNGS